MVSSNAAYKEKNDFKNEHMIFSWTGIVPKNSARSDEID